MIAYSFVVAYGFFEVVFRGKEVCKHGTSKKSGLKVNKSEEMIISVNDEINAQK